MHLQKRINQEITVKRFGEGLKYPVTELLLLSVALFWGTSYGLTKISLLHTSVLLFIAIRFSITFLCMLPVVLHDFSRGLNKDWVIAIPTGFILAAIFFCEVFGVLHTTASNAAFLISLSVIMTAFAELVVNKKRISRKLLVLAIVSVIGVCLLTSKQNISLFLNFGDFLILVAALLRALMVTVTKRVSHGKIITTATLTSIQSFVVAACAAIAALLFLPPSQIVFPVAAEFWIIIAYLVTFCTLFAFYVQNHAVRNTSPTRVSLLMGSEPLFGALFAIIFLQEALTALQVVGAMLIFICVIVTSMTNENTAG